MPIKLEVVTVERLLYSDDVDIVVAPGAEGVLGILPKHAPLLTSLKIGELMIRKDGEEKVFAIGGGYMEVQPDKVTVLADSAEHANEINLDRAQEARDRAAHLIASGNLLPEDLIRAEAAMRRASLRIRIAKQSRSR
jgi:F-type H+-transporting ATPase subunit epsilon